MELGGNAPCIVEDLVPDLEGTIARLMIGGFYQAGQSCIHMQRLYVKENLYEQVLRKRNLEVKLYNLACKELLLCCSRWGPQARF
jgi:acyl-CoA reductase-like NAD-dependent aldehyde dehydrogenase